LFVRTKQISFKSDCKRIALALTAKKALSASWFEEPTELKRTKQYETTGYVSGKSRMNDDQASFS
jgi:hypothetical protein